MYRYGSVNAHERFEALASGYGCQDDCGVESRPGGAGGDLRDASPTVVHMLKVMKDRNSQAWEPVRAAYAFTFIAGLVSQASENLCRKIPGCLKTKNWAPSNDTPIPDQSIRRHGPLVPIFHMGLLEAVTRRNPSGLPVAKPSGHPHYAGQKEALLPSAIVKVQITGPVFDIISSW